MSLDLAKVAIVDDDIIRGEITSGPLWRSFGLKSWAHARDIAPVGTSEPVPGTRQPARKHGSFKTSIELKFYFGADGHFEIGSKETVDNGMSLFDIIERGTVAHPIDAHDPPTFLVFKGKSGVVFTPHVDHPGTKKNPFVERAAQQILHQMDGLSLVHA